MRYAVCSGPRQFSAYLKGSLLELVLMSFCFVKLINFFYLCHLNGLGLVSLCLVKVKFRLK